MYIYSRIHINRGGSADFWTNCHEVFQADDHPEN